MYYLFRDNAYHYGSRVLPHRSKNFWISEKTALIRLLRDRLKGLDTVLHDKQGIDVTPSEDVLTRLSDMIETVEAYGRTQPPHQKVMWRKLADEFTYLMYEKKNGMAIRYISHVDTLSGKEVRELGMKAYVHTSYNKRFVLTCGEEDQVLLSLTNDVKYTIMLPPPDE